MWYLIEKHRPLKCQVNSLDYGSVLGKKKPNLFDFNGSSLSSIFPETSSVTSPDYTNFNSNIANSQIQNNVNLSNPVADFQKSGSQIVNDAAFKTGQALSSSSNLSTKMQGQQMVKNSINDPSGQRFQQNSTQSGTQNAPKTSATDTPKTSTADGLNAGFSALGQIGDKVGGTAGKVMSGVGNVGSSVINLTKQAKAAGGFKNLSGAAKANGVAGAAGAAADLIGSFMPRKTEYDGPKGNITETMDTVYDSISDAAMSIPGPGMMIGGIMKAGAILGKGMNALGGGTDGMCVCTGTKVFTAKGSIVNIENLKKEDGIIGWDETKKQIVPQLIHNFIEPRQKECVEITLKNGYSIKCSIDHPILSDSNPKAKSKTINGKRIAIRPWKFRRADELKVGDFVGLANNIDYWGDTSIPNAYVVGLLIGDGSYGKGASCRLISADPDTWKYLENNNLGVLNLCDDSRPEKYSKEIRTYRIIGGMELLHQLGIAYQTGKNKTLPKNIGKFDKSSVCNLLAGLFDTDGSISVNEEKQNYSITLYQSNINLLEEVRMQLHKLGIFSTIGIRKAAKYELGGRIINSNESYRLEIHDISSAIKFYNLIPLNISYKKESLERIYNMLKDKRVQEHNDISGAKQCKIVSITPIGVQTVYNLQADYNHTYLANCIITHNTTTDAILGSSFFNLTPMGLINGFGGKKADTITKNTDAFDTVGSSYSGTNAKVDDALTKSGKKYGLFSSSARQEANREIAEAKRQQRVVADIADQSRTNTALQQSMSAINSNKRKLALEGGYDQASVRAGKQGMAIEHKPTQISLIKKISEFREGGNVKIQSTQIMLTAAIPEFKNGGSVNVLPDGALHARKHHMEVEGITEKGIPVIDNNGKQQAEIEHSEIIFRLEVTEKLEELEKKYSESNDDKYALEAGELLVKEILHNTDDRTGLIDTLKKGGTLNLHNNVSPTQSDIDNMVKQALINILTK